MKPIYIPLFVGALALAACTTAGTAGADDPVVQQDTKKQASEKKADTVVLYVLDAKGSG